MMWPSAARQPLSAPVSGELRSPRISPGLYAGDKELDSDPDPDPANFSSSETASMLSSWVSLVSLVMRCRIWEVVLPLLASTTRGGLVRVGPYPSSSFSPLDPARVSGPFDAVGVHHSPSQSKILHLETNF